MTVRMDLHTTHGEVPVPLGLLRFDQIDQPVRHSIGPRIHVLCPRVCCTVQDGKEKDHANQQRRVTRILHARHLNLAIGTQMIPRHIYTVHHPREDRFHEGSVQQVDGEAHLAEEEQNAAGQQRLQARAEHNADGGEHEADAAGEARQIGVLG